MADIEFQSSQIAASSARSFQALTPQVRQRQPERQSASTPRFLRVTVRYDVPSSQLFIQFRNPDSGKLIDTVPKEAKPRPPKKVEVDLVPNKPDNPPPSEAESNSAPTASQASQPSTTVRDVSSTSPPANGNSAQPATPVPATRGEVVDQRA